MADGSGAIMAEEAVSGVRGAPFQEIVHEMLRQLGEDPSRQGLLKTPERMEKSLKWLTRGYSLSVRDVVGDAIFDEEHHNMVVVKDIEMYSMCEHHMLPFFGRAHVAYIPSGKILGLSKVPRIVDVFARRLQVQERLTDQVAQAVWEVLE
ncbi:MAG TPA: GTP cyclohydrolase I, partial [Longimicrobiales bacterium]|nr:GTP cyclohydrolase I [Longimicrobiales bacterium]